MSKRMQTVFKRVRGPVGNVIWTVGGYRFYWNGPGSRINLMFGDQLVPIDAPEANGNYDTVREAEAAVRRFTGLPPLRAKRRRS